MKKSLVILTAIISALFTIFIVKTGLFSDTDSVSTAGLKNNTTLYVWSLKGMDIKETPYSQGINVGRLEYGDKIEFDPEEFYKLDDNSHQEIFLPGGIPEMENYEIEDQATLQLDPIKNTIYFKGGWIKIKINGKSGYVFTGFLSRLPPPSKNEDSTYFSKFFTLSGSDTLTKETDYLKTMKTWKEGIILIETKTDKGFKGSYCLSDLTLNEGLLFAWRLLGIEVPDSNIKPKELFSSENYYGLKSTDEYIEINYPAPNGIITIRTEGDFIIIYWDGTC